MLFLLRYLAEDQLRGPSDVEMYIRALRRGCRCVECKLKKYCCNYGFLFYVCLLVPACLHVMYYMWDYTSDAVSVSDMYDT